MAVSDRDKLEFEEEKRKLEQYRQQLLLEAETIKHKMKKEGSGRKP